MLYNNLSSYLKNKYGGRLTKICVDGGFTCPNRDGTAGYGGCIYCSERGSGDHITQGASITEQVRRVTVNADASARFIVYFQNFTNTYETCDVLRERYDAALVDERIAVLAIGTRPDCIDEERADLIASYKDKADVWVELGLQTASDGIARIINRGYETDVYRRACEILRTRGIPVVTHIMIGLPGESESDVIETVRVVNESAPFGVKIHSVYVPCGTELERMYLRGDYIPLTLDEYASRAATAISHLTPDTVLHRITGDCPTEMLVAPMWNADKFAVIDAINRVLSQRGARQGSDFNR
jgi:radical SAM protein (TIGR01212 family)